MVYLLLYGSLACMVLEKIRDYINMTQKLELIQKDLELNEDQRMLGIGFVQIKIVAI